jgi:hypothetical protein
MKILTALFAVLLFSATNSFASPITELETGGNATNNTIATAQVIPGSAFTTPVPATVFNPPGFPTVTITGLLGSAADPSSDVDFYSFTANAGQIYIDIDSAEKPVKLIRHRR